MNLSSYMGRWLIEFTKVTGLDYWLGPAITKWKWKYYWLSWDLSGPECGDFLDVIMHNDRGTLYRRLSKTMRSGTMDFLRTKLRLKSGCRWLTWTPGGSSFFALYNHNYLLLVETQRVGKVNRYHENQSLSSLWTRMAQRRRRKSHN